MRLRTLSTAMRLCSVAVCSVVLFAACASSPVADAAPPVHRQTITVTIEDHALLPAATVHIEPFATVVWCNRTTTPATVEVMKAACPQCETVLGFAKTATGARSNDIAPGGIATLCFHEPGTFAFVVHLGNVEQGGSIEVGPGQ